MFFRKPIILLFCFVTGFAFPVISQSTEATNPLIPAKPLDPKEPKGERPYEMVWAKRAPEHPPLVNFDSLEGWTLEGIEGGSGELSGSQKQRVWESPVGRLVYKGTSEKSMVTLRPPKPIDIPAGVSATTIWIYGNNWDWVPDPKTPKVIVCLQIHDKTGKIYTLELTRVRWQEWWLVHKVLPKELTENAPLKLSAIQIGNCGNSENREIFLEDLTFYQEKTEPLTFEPRPKRGVDPFPGQSPGANIGEERLPFPTREMTILPENYTTDYSTMLSGSENDWSFVYKGSDGELKYGVHPKNNYWGAVEVVWNDKPMGKVLVDAGPRFDKELRDLKLNSQKLEGDVLHGVWKGKLEEKEITIESSLRLWQKSLVVDFICRGGQAVELSYGYVTDLQKPELIQLPFLNYHGHHLQVLMSQDAEKPISFFTSVWLDWYRSNASTAYAEDKIEGNRIRLNGGVKYNPKTDGNRNDLFERFFVTASPIFEETLPTIPNPPAKRGKEAGTRLWQESWGPEDYAREHERSEKLRAYGIEKLTQCNHEISWRDGGESFTFRTRSAPKKGGDEALQQYIRNQQALGWRAGLYTNYTDFAPVNEYWSTDAVMRTSDGNLITAWPRCYSPKAQFAVEMDRKLAPIVQKKFNTNAAYTDVHTSVAPWDRTDYDVRVPGAGTFAATFYAYGELLLHDQDVYDGHCWSEGNHQWMYSGLCTGNYGLSYSPLRLWEYPYLPHFDLLKMHPLTVDIGVPWTGQFFHDNSNWSKPENIVAAIDQFIAATIAYGHIGWLVEEAHGMRQTCRSYYMLQPLQSRYVMLKPETIQYGDASGKLFTTSQALGSGLWKESRLFIQYPNDLKIWINGNPKENWKINDGSASHVLPPYGWAAIKADEFYEASELLEGKRMDRVSSPESIFLDGRDSSIAFDGVGTSGSVAVRKAESGLSIITVEGVKDITLTSVSETHGAEDIRTVISRLGEKSTIQVKTYNIKGEELEPPSVSKIAKGWKIPAIQEAIRYEVR